MLSPGAIVIIWDEMLSSGAFVIIGANVIIWSKCYHPMLSCDVVVWDDNNPLFYFSWKLHSLDENSANLSCLSLCYAVELKIP
jgi:hypothetical protein